MKSTLAPLFFPLALSLAACSGDAPGPLAPEGIGSLELALESAPDDARCLVATFEGGRGTKTGRFDLTSGEQRVVERLPAGLLTIDVQAFPEACALVGADAEPSYVLESPITARVRPGRVSHVAIHLVHSGGVSLDVDFEDGELSGDDEPLTLAVIGDTPYGAAQLEAFPTLVAAINADAENQLALHLGDIKNGSTRCDDSYFARIADDFAEFRLPLVFTPGDNEWTDCHRANNGAYDPLERLETLRAVFFPEPGTTLGAPLPILSQSTVPEHATFVENRLWAASSVVFASVHVVGSDNGEAPWFGTDTTGTLFDDPERRLAEVAARESAALDWIERSFALAGAEDAKGVVLAMQADTFLSTAGFENIITLIADLTREFERPVLLLQGDSHVYTVDQPFANGNAAYGITEPVPNLTRLVVQGQTASEWIKLTVDPESEAIFRWERKLVE